MFLCSPFSAKPYSEPQNWCRGMQEPAPELRFVVVLWGEVTPECAAALPCPVVTFEEVLASGRAAAAAGWAPARVQPQDLATLVYTSGTTGQPKVLVGCLPRAPVYGSETWAAHPVCISSSCILCAYRHHTAHVHRIIIHLVCISSSYARVHRIIIHPV